MNKTTSAMRETNRNVASPTKKPQAWQFGNFMHKLAYLCVALAIVLAVTQFWLYGLRFSRVFSPNLWSSVTLINGQSYIGRLEQYGPGTVVLFDAYYLQAVTAAGDEVTADPALAETTDLTDTASDSDAADLQLMSIGNDLHKPYPYLVINRDQIIYWQHLTAESPIVQTLENQK
jgi:hypothetical protein